MLKRPTIILLAAMSIGVGLTSSQTTNMKTYQVKKTRNPIQITGRGFDTSWKRADVLTDFTYPWRKETAPLTTFRALWDDTYFYFLYRAIDPEILTKERGLGERDAVDSDRVEIFFKADDDMDPYYALEMDALGRVLDTRATYHRNIDYHWNWPEGHLLLKATIDAEGYWVEGSITWESLRQLGMYKDDHILKAGLFRGEYQTNEVGSVVTKWISWVMPDSQTPDFHIPSSFGVLELVE